ncbi:unnamed protein product [Anisakis simplex]|uniref:Zinc finger protein n=1 Tax=Anisakis simplex TaxID=6269 RepID=A0A0M3JUI1_ANISI|nr:unnamed protein product [Anisakis simplex]
MGYKTTYSTRYKNSTMKHNVPLYQFANVDGSELSAKPNASFRKSLKHAKRNKTSDLIEKPHKCHVCCKSFGKKFELSRHLVVHTKERRFNCEKCGKKFSQRSSLSQHVQMHNEEEALRHKCTLCGASFSQAGNLRRHVTLLHPTDVASRTVFRCPHCTCVFNSVQPLQVHMRKRHQYDSSASQSPKSKNESFPVVVENLKQQEAVTSESQQNIRNRRRLVCCSICGKAFGKCSDLLRHYRVHSGNRPFSCNRCHKNFAWKSSLKLHSEKHIREENAYNYNECSRCHLCMKQLSSTTSLRRHIKLHARSSERCATCSQLCVPQENSEVSEMNEIENEAQQLISDGNDLAVQLFGDADLQTTDVMQKGHHQSQLGNECVFDEFGMIANAYPSLVEQPSSSAVINEPRCPVCLFTFHSETALCSHLANMNIDPAHEFAVLICSICEKSFTGSTQLSEHLRTVHMKDLQLEHVQAAETVKPPAVNVTAVSDEKKHKCGVCGRAFKKPSDLQRHTRIHTGEKPFVCGVCDRAFRVKSTLYQHMKVHDDQNDSIFEVCAVCGKCYCSKSALKQHLLFAHAQHRPFKCTVDTCDQHFQSVRHRDAHVQRFHGNESTNIDNAACIAHKTDASSDLVYDSRDQFIQTAQQLAPSSKNLTTIEPSFTSAFSRPINQNEWNASTNIAIRLSPHTRSGNVLVHINVVSGIPPEDGSVVIELSMLKPLSSEGISLKIPISLPFLTSGSFMAVDAHRILMMLSKTESGTLMVPMNVSTEVTNFPVAVFGALMTTEVAFERAAFTTSCHVCSQYFMSAEESEAHFAGEDHETAELLSFTELNTNPVGNTTLNALTNQYLPSITTKHMANEVCKLCTEQFDNHEGLLLHIRRVHEGDSIDILARRDHFNRRRTLN